MQNNHKVGRADKVGTGLSSFAELAFGFWVLPFTPGIKDDQRAIRWGGSYKKTG